VHEKIPHVLPSRFLFHFSLDVAEVGHRKGCFKAGRHTCLSSCSEVSGRKRKYNVSYCVPKTFIFLFILPAPVLQNKLSAGQREGTSAMGTGNGFLSTPTAGRIPMKTQHSSCSQKIISSLQLVLITVSSGVLT